MTSSTITVPSTGRSDLPLSSRFYGAILLLLVATGIYLYRSLLSSEIPHIVSTQDIHADWSSSTGGNFDPRNKCPEDFFAEGFQVLYRKVASGDYFHFLYHQGKKLLYRIDVDDIAGKQVVGLHWVESTRYNSKYRIVDPSFKGGKTLDVPTGTTTSKQETFTYGQTVSKNKSARGRELFEPTHPRGGNCPSWWDILDFLP